MNIVIRTDASVQIGSGHVMRCLMLAEELREVGGNIIFICREEAGNLRRFIENKGYPVKMIRHEIPHNDPNFDLQKADAEATLNIINEIDAEIDWLIVDHYSLDEDWESRIRPRVNRLMVIDDLANRRHECDILLDQNFHVEPEMRYASLVPETCIKLLGPRYLLLRKEFIAEKRRLKPRDGTIRQIMIFYGGSDPTDETMKALRAVQELPLSSIQVDFIVGQANTHKNEIRRICNDVPNFHYHCQIDNMAWFMAHSDLSLGAGGITMWERCYLGVPTIATVVADNQSDSTSAVAAMGALWNMGWHANVTEQHLADMINRAIRSPQELIEMSKKALHLMDNDNDRQRNRVVEELIRRSRA
ncbi:UDP-2,4-diacetamido-2,4,6-trideoxy-beta-L-altropyranose hydrolase [Paenibacillus sp. MSJ-34]|uniref:UDP-2,4-diacetamido-2,4, 6-trideoxy-beta-L-altropyranose hydrolase n=1 Tax=Paenibacillus sp. MSJ-34 TaxID=2841529 RepID=UPI001C10C9C8|nr:UDP-2,4-diacetamido-2,4,6-trideoxy-beta-L-altropyranose hydrolase [Paenibacillus sp. MSJ-34]MBU5441010.1 UDP-2,4-diacetamido-2,4,6-trideoxy-beta-L-altropyranose hydrolase [Paenibacillus sp. MSJ-34]